jgi:hypothetical protein
VLKRQSEEEKEAKRLQKLASTEEARRRADEKERERQRQAFLASPGGRAREAFERGDFVFQYSIDVHTTQATVVAMAGAFTKSKETNDPTDVLNSVCHEGWEVVNGSFVFLELGSESRDKFMASGQQVAVKGTVLGYYLFKRCESNKREIQMPWEVPVTEPPRELEPEPAI